MDQRDALLQAVIAAPDDDLPRLAMADFLRENGEGDRADFIEVQVELAKGARCQWTGAASLCQMHGGRRCEVCELRRRERELWAAGLIRWTAGAVIANAAYRLPDESVPAGAIGVIYRRGFIDEIRLPLAAWVGGECGWCRGTGLDSRMPEWGCMECGGSGHMPGTGTTPALGPRLVREHPLTRVVAVDREPNEDDGGFQWASATDTSGWRFDVHRESLPMEVAKHLRGGRHHPETKSIVAQWWYPTRAAALDALSQSLLAWARSPERQPVPASAAT